jgi:hypothetical protein
MVGDLRVVPSQDIGPLGPHDGDAVIFHWSFLWVLVRLVPTAAVIALALLRRSGGAPRWPVVLVCLVLQALMYAAEAFSGALDPFFRGRADLLIDIGLVLTPGLGLMWLLSDFIIGCFPLKAFGAALRILIVSILLAALFDNTWSPSADLLEAITLGLGSGTGLLLGLVFARHACRARYSPARFLIWLFLGLIVISTLWVSPLALLGIVPWRGGVFGSVSSSGVVFGSALFALLLPFLAVTFANRTYRQRFETIFGFPGPATGREGDTPAGGP